MYQALYRKYRPQTFDDVVGQLSVTQTLKNQILTGHLSHAYLFTGTRGTGKTSCAKILAKAVNCENPIDGNPCNHCAACRSIDSGACMDVLEIDAASNNGVDSIRALRDDAQFTPSEVKTRVYIIDEVHMLSTSAFNALLKIIEEPPAHLLFILATTELQSIPATILSRCQRFSFRRITPADITARLNYIAYQEHITLEPEAASFLARLADGGLRDAVSLLDQCASATTESVTVDQVCRTLGIAGARATAAMLRAIAKHDTAETLAVFNEQYVEGKDLAAMLNELCAVTRDLLICKTAPKDAAGQVTSICTGAELKELLPLWSVGELLRTASILRDAAVGFNISTNRRIDAELCLIRLCEPEATLDAQALNARLSRLEEKLASGQIVAAPQAKPETEEAPPWDDDAPPPYDDGDVPPEPGGAPAQPAAAPAPTGFWPELVDRLRTALKPPAMGMFSTADNAPVRGRLSGDRLLLITENEFTFGIVNRPNVLQTVSEKAAALLGRPVAVQVQKGGAEQPDSAGFEKLLRFGAEHSDIVDIK